MDKIPTHRSNDAIADPSYAIAESLFAEALQDLGDKFQMVFNRAGGDASAHKGGLTFDRRGGAGRLRYVDLIPTARNCDSLGIPKSVKL
jgi:hypothetical protein